MKIFLIGLPGSGKTTLGRALASQLKIRFIDLDQEIENHYQKSVSDIFNTSGETFFRKAEHDLLKTFCHQNESFVMATGGGAPCFHQNMNLINQAGISIFLDISVDSIHHRIVNSHRNNRPMFANLNAIAIREKISHLRAQRIDFYQRARFTLKGDEISVQEVIPLLEGKS